MITGFDSIKLTKFRFIDQWRSSTIIGCRLTQGSIIYDHNLFIFTLIT